MEKQKFVRVAGHTNWFLVLEPNQEEPEGLSEKFQEKLLRTVSGGLHAPKGKDKFDLIHRLKMVATQTIDYEYLANRYGTILIRPIGSYMLLRGNTITEEVYSYDFPIANVLGEILVCENDKMAEPDWIAYLKNRFPEKRITILNFFDLMTKRELDELFYKSEYITFSTTFTNLGWFRKLSQSLSDHNKVIGYCHDSSKWDEAKEIFDGVEIVESIK